MFEVTAWPEDGTPEVIVYKMVDDVLMAMSELLTFRFKSKPSNRL